MSDDQPTYSRCFHCRLCCFLDGYRNPSCCFLTKELTNDTTGIGLVSDRDVCRRIFGGCNMVEPKNFWQLPKTEARLKSLMVTKMKPSEIARLLNREFPHPTLRCNRSSVRNKMERLGYAAERAYTKRGVMTQEEIDAVFEGHRFEDIKLKG